MKAVSGVGLEREGSTWTKTCYFVRNTDTRKVLMSVLHYGWHVKQARAGNSMRHLRDNT